MPLTAERCCRDCAATLEFLNDIVQVTNRANAIKDIEPFRRTTDHDDLDVIGTVTRREIEDHRPKKIDGVEWIAADQRASVCLEIYQQHSLVDGPDTHERWTRRGRLVGNIFEPITPYR